MIVYKGGGIIDEVFTVREVAERLKITEIAVRNYILDGSLQASKLGRVWRITESDLKSFLENMKPVRNPDGKPAAEVAEEIRQEMGKDEE